MKILLAFVLLLIGAEVFANDGMFYSNGGNLVPVNETSIEMRKEVLYLKRVPGGMEVNVYFEFYNPGEARDEIVGFVTPPSSAEYYDSDMETYPKGVPMHPYIKGFMVMVNGQLLPYKIARMEDTGFNTDQPISLSQSGYDYVYYFNVHFEPGMNIIRHHYVFAGSTDLGSEQFTYRLTTAKLWANKAIGDFELIIDAPDYMRVPESLTESHIPIPWQIVGIGRYEANDYDLNGNAFMKNGCLRYHTTDFSPDFDIVITFPRAHVMYDEITKGGFNNNGVYLLMSSLFGKVDTAYLSDEESLSTEEIQTLINFLYATKGLLIRKAESAALFAKAIWYMPDPNLNAEDIVFTANEQLLVDALAAERNKRKNQ